jgi:hypothetical protein
MDYNGLQVVLINKAEPIYRKYVDSNNAPVDPTSPFVRVYNPSGVEVASGAPTKQSTGVYYYSLTLTTAAANIEGLYSAYW